MRILHAKFGLRGNTEDSDIANAHAIRLAERHFDAVMLAIPSWHEYPRPLENPIFTYALAMAAEARLNIIICRNLWDAWTDDNSTEEAPFQQGWYEQAISAVKVLSHDVALQSSRPVYTALDCEPMGGKCPQKWLQNAWDESKRPAIDAAIRKATFNAGRVHYAMPTTTLGKGKSRYAASMGELCERRICWQTYRLQPMLYSTSVETNQPLFISPKYWAPPEHAARRDVRGLWVTHRDGGRDEKTGKQVLTIKQALSCPEDSFWYSTDMPAMMKQVAGGEK